MLIGSLGWKLHGLKRDNGEHTGAMRSWSWAASRASSRYSASRIETQVSICTTNRFGVTAQFSFHSALNIGHGDLFEGTSGL